MSSGFCERTFEEVDMNLDVYPKAVAHGVHSLNLESLRYFFEPDATEVNGIPNVNLNYSVPNPIQNDVTLAGYDTSLER